MKLFSKYNRVTIASSIVIFLFGCTTFYFVFRFVLLLQLDRTLRTEQTEVISYVEEYKELPAIVLAYDQEITFTEVDKPITQTNYYSLQRWDDKEQEFEWMRQMSFGITVNGKHYKTTVTKSQMETDDLLSLILWIAVGMVSLVLLAGYIINFFLLNRLWKPFYHTLDETEKFQLSQQKALQLPATGITEFDLLNKQLNEMTTRIQKDYAMLKTFTGNAAHEMQTPLAVIRTNIESLMQDDETLRRHEKTIGHIESSGNRLARLNKALLLMAKIENRQFELNERVDVAKLIETKRNEWMELISSQKLHMEAQVEPFTTTFNPHLVEVLIDNLFNNAIRYNIPHGEIGIRLQKERLYVANTSAIPALDRKKIFQRFYRHEQTVPEGNGLGLSIVKEVCDLAGWTLAYEYKNDLHIFSIQF